MPNIAQTKPVQWPPRVPRNFPLTVAPRGYVKRIAGRLRWICGRVPPKEALKAYHRKASALLAGARPVAQPKQVGGIVTLHYILSRWIIDRRDDAERGELTYGSFGQYRDSAKAIDAIAGHYNVADVTPDSTRAIYDRLAKDHTLDFAKRAVAHLRTCCRHAEEQGWCAPVRLGQKTVAKLIARPKVSMKWRLYTPAEIRTILDALEAKIRTADGRSRPSLIQLRAMIYLALNGGYGAQELADLPRAVVDLAGGCIDYRRGKTGADHIVPLWPETIAALEPVLSLRPGDELMFRTREGNPWCFEAAKYREGRLVGKIDNDNVNQRFTELVKPLGLKTHGVGFYKLRHLFATTADRCIDRNAVSVLMGHSLGGSRDHYIRVGVDRLRQVVEFVRHELLTNVQH